MLNQQLNLVAIPGHEDYYASESGSIYSYKTNKFLKQPVTTNGYLKVYLQVNKKSTTFLAHRIIAKTFIPNTNDLPCVNHIDGNKQNNNVNNLEWCTYSENSNHDFALKKDKRARKNQFTGFRETIKEQAVAHLLTGMNCVEVSKILNVSPHTIGVIAKESSETKENSYRSYKLDDYKVIEILKLLKQKVTQRKIALMYNIDPSAVYAIKKGLIYKHITSEYCKA